MSAGNGVTDPDKPTEADKACDDGWARALAHHQDQTVAVAGIPEPYVDSEPEQRPTSDHGRPVDDGPGEHHAHARTDYTPTRPGKVQDF